MKHSKFIDLTADKQFKAWKKLGVRVAVRKTPVFYFVLYQVADFYIEAKFLRGSDELLTFNSFTSTTPLTPYLKKIDISGIFDK